MIGLVFAASLSAAAPAPTPPAIRTDSMIAGLALPATRPAVAASSPPLPTEGEIVVTGRRWDRVQYAAGVNRMTGRTRCQVTVSSGDPAIDREVCEIAKACAMLKPRKRALIEACVESRKRQFLRTYVPPAREGKVE